MQSERRKFKRTANACIPCRQSKIKCSGDEPCANCQRRFMKCRFSEAGNKVIVSQRYLHSLQKQVADQQSASQTNTPSEATGVSSDKGNESQIIETPTSPVPGLSEHARSIWTSPFTLPSTIIKNSYRNRLNWIWLAPSSMWSFTARLMVMMTDKLHLDSPSNTPNVFDKDVYPSLHWKTSSFDEPPDISGLPSIDHASYLFNTVKFHLGHDYQLFNEELFLKNMREFYYGNAAEKAAENRLWFVQFLLVLAFGKAFLGQSKNSTDAPGSAFFLRAVSLMPDHPRLWKDSLLAIEVLAMIGMYFYSVDHREMAHVYLGQAIRIAQLVGLHTQLPEEELGVETVTRSRKLWWTLYIMDRHFSFSLGLPVTTQDSDITTALDPPGIHAQSSSTLSLQVKLSHLMSFIVSSIYKTEKTQLGTFLEMTRSILQTMAGHAQEIESIINRTSRNAVDIMPKGTRHVSLLYHQCVTFATRPLLLSVLKERLEKLDTGGEDWENFISLTKPLISTGIKSAVKTLQILSEEDSLVEVFLPFDLEFTYGAAIHLTIAYTLFPHVADGPAYSKIAHSILDEMISKGNKLAEVRKSELTHIEMLFKEFALRTEQQGLETLTLLTPDAIIDPRLGIGSKELKEGDSAIDTEMSCVPMASHNLQVPTSHPHASTSVELDNLGISSEEFLSIMDQMDTQDFGYGMLDQMGDWQEDDVSET
ncbi:Zn(II)2Cys6 transcription factor [Mariannaea sp. PMI_226]|nr:Zn(II)2Cys6 transcription factor [Mariannaea sp. PMI_226]